MAWSAWRMSASGVPVRAPAKAIPKLADASTDSPSNSNGAARPALMRSAMITASRSPPKPSHSTMNSSPPNRATVSLGRIMEARRSDTFLSRRSPTSWP